MTAMLAAAPRSSLPRTTLLRIAERLGLAAETRLLAPVPHGVDRPALAELSDHLLRDIGFVREPGVSLSPTLPYL
jgi:hypothetical protein